MIMTFCGKEMCYQRNKRQSKFDSSTFFYHGQGICLKLADFQVLFPFVNVKNIKNVYAAGGPLIL